MALVYDDTFEEYIEDIKNKKAIARSARNRRGNCGRRGSIRFSSDNLTDSQRKALNSEVKTYRMNVPMTWDEFISMPDDLKVEYIKSLRKKFNVPDFEIASMLGVDIDALHFMYNTIKLRKNTESICDFKRWSEWKGENV